MIRKYLWPTHFYEDIYKITPNMLKNEGIDALICDIDNTIVTYDDPEPTETAARWLSDMRGAGISLAFVSNNEQARVERFCRTLGCYYMAKSGKPGSRGLCGAMEHMGTTRQNTAMLGDQLFTDIFAGSRIGLRTILVLPIKDKLTPLFRFKRALEKPILRAYLKTRGMNS
ncbi:MAG: YqeG family HAD IIIA-type phosphatase [Eubacteriales bacterium]